MVASVVVVRAETLVRTESVKAGRKAAQEFSPRRKPWAEKWNQNKPQRGEREATTQPAQERSGVQECPQFS